VNPLLVIDGIRMADKIEIAAMKLWAITNRGTRKDFVDLYFLLKEISLTDMMNFFRKKIPNAEILMVLRSLMYYVDAEMDESPVMLIPADWSAVKETIRKETEAFVMEGKRKK
jgi:hypothetical protein